VARVGARCVPLARNAPGARHSCDGVSELWFDSEEAFEAAYASEIGQAVAADSLANVSGRVRLVVDERPQLEP
jgi:uncharacterized protein (TIGR02118 family)